MVCSCFQLVYSFLRIEFDTLRWGPIAAFFNSGDLNSEEHLKCSCVHMEKYKITHKAVGIKKSLGKVEKKNLSCTVPVRNNIVFIDRRCHNRKTLCCIKPLIIALEIQPVYWNKLIFLARKCATQTLFTPTVLHRQTYSTYELAANKGVAFIQSWLKLCMHSTSSYSVGSLSTKL